jgi:hypothetical protein
MMSKAISRSLFRLRPRCVGGIVNVQRACFSSTHHLMTNQEKRQFRSPFAPQPASQPEKEEVSAVDREPFDQVLADAKKDYEKKKGVVCVGETKTEKGERAIIVFTSSDFDKNTELPQEYKGYPVVQVEGALGGMPF